MTTDRQGDAETLWLDVSRRYFELGIPCPFIEDQACSIYPDRPLTCREFLVTTPPERCATFGGATRAIDRPVRMSEALAGATHALLGVQERQIPLALSLEWAEVHGADLDVPTDGERAFFALVEAAEKSPEPGAKAGKEGSGETEGRPPMILRLAEREDEPFLWQMLYEAAHMADAGEPLEAAMSSPGLARYVAGWGREHDLGYITVDPSTGLPVAAAWIRLMQGAGKGYGHVSDTIPELSIGCLPGYRGRGVGTALLTALLRDARGKHAAISLSVRDDNPAMRLYQRLGFEPLPSSATKNRVGGQSFTMVAKLG